MTARRPWRRCPACDSTCSWVDPTWVCKKCGREWNRQAGEQFLPPGKVDLDLATCSYMEHQPGMGVGVRTSLGVPRWIRRTEPWPYVPEIAPRKQYLNAPESVFIDAYLQQLRSVGVTRIRSELQAIQAKHPGERLVLLCFEKLTKAWCHRTLFGAWWYTQTGQRVPELGEVATHEQLTIDLLDGGS